MDNSDQNKAAVRECFAAASGGDLDALDALIAPDYVLHEGSEDIRGVEGLREMAETYRNAFSGFRITVEHQLTEGDYVATRYTARGRHDGEFMGLPPTGRDFMVSGICISRCRDGKLVDEWEVADELGALRQIGALPEMVES